MKTFLSKTNLTAIALFLLLLPGLNSCKKDKDENPAVETGLNGAWVVNSFTIDGVEAKGLIIAASELEFDADNDSSGNFSWSITYMDSTTDRVTGDYELSDDKIILDSHGDQALEFDLTVAGDILEMSGGMDEGYVVVKADRK